MSTTSTRISGLTTMLGSGLLIAALALNLFVRDEQPALAFLYGLGALLLAVGAPGLLPARGSRWHGLGIAGLALTVLGLLLVTLSVINYALSLIGVKVVEEWWYALMAGFFGVLAGMALYASWGLSQREIPTWAGAPLVAGGAGTTLALALTFLPESMLSEANRQLLGISGMTLTLVFLIGWGLLGLALWQGRVGSEMAKAPRTAAYRALLPLILLIVGSPLLVVGISLVTSQSTARDKAVAQAYATPMPTRIIAPSGSARPVVIDTDMALDDWTAILYLLNREEIRVEAITVAGTGLSHCGPGVAHARELLALAGYPQIPVACGRETPLEGGHSFPAAWRDDSDNLHGLSLPDAPASPYNQNAPQLLTEAIKTHPGKLTLIALGPLTNVADALRDDPTLATDLHALYIMGGAVEVEGNVGRLDDGGGNDWAEWNIYADPVAAAAVFGSGAPITLVPLDATNSVPATRSFLERLEQQRATPSANFVYDLIERNWEWMEAGDYYFWDTLAAVLLTDESLATYRTLELQVVIGGPQDGRTAITAGGAKVRVAVSADAARFERLFLETINTINTTSLQGRRS